MKKLLLFIPFIIVIIFSCDKKNGKSDLELITGQWSYDSMRVLNYKNNDVFYDNTLNQNHLLVEFLEDGTGSCNGINGNWKLNGDTLTTDILTGMKTPSFFTVNDIKLVLYYTTPDEYISGNVYKNKVWHYLSRL